MYAPAAAAQSAIPAGEDEGVGVLDGVPVPLLDGVPLDVSGTVVGLGKGALERVSNSEVPKKRHAYQNEQQAQPLGDHPLTHHQ